VTLFHEACVHEDREVGAQPHEQAGSDADDELRLPRTIAPTANVIAWPSIRGSTEYTSAENRR
jgi:hypothetical protein